MTHERIGTNPAVADGVPVILGTRVPVYQVLTRIAAGQSPAQIVAELRELSLGDVKAALTYAAAVVRDQVTDAEPPAQVGNVLPASDVAVSSDEATGLDLNKILIVDDDELNRLYMQSMFRKSEFALSVASDGEDALAKARAELPFLVLSDVQMPLMDGFELCRQLKADERTKSAAVIFVTAHHRSSQKVVEGLEMGGDDYIFRPFERSELLSRVKAVARLKRAEEEARRQAQTVARRNKELQLLNDIGHALASTLDLDQILLRTTQLVQESLRAEAASLWLLDEENQELVLTASSGPGAQRLTGLRLPIHGSIVGHVTQTGEPFSSANGPDADLGYPPIDTGDDPPASILCVPVEVKARIIGVIHAHHERARWFDQNALRLLSSVASSVGIAIENAWLFGEVQELNRHLERKVAERTRELAEEKDKTEAILTSMADALLVLDAENRILTSNAVAEGMLDFRLSEAQGQPIARERLSNPLWRCISDLAVSADLTACASVEVPDPAQWSGVLSIQALAARIRDESDQVIGTVIVLRDITAITEVERMKARFMSGITHELKTPLSVIRLHAKNLQAYHTRLPEERRTEFLNGIQSQVTLLEQLVEDILELSRLDAGESASDAQPVDLAEVADEVATDLLTLAHGKQIALRWKKPSANVIVLAEGDQIRRVIRNLVANAIKYTPSGGAVDLRLTSEDNETVKIRVADTGIGIPKEHQARVFDRFYRVDPSHTTPGTGLGLAIVKEIVTAHGGDIQLESAPGKGSTFTVTLPGLERSGMNPPTT